MNQHTDTFGQEWIEATETPTRAASRVIDAGDICWAVLPGYNDQA